MAKLLPIVLLLVALCSHSLAKHRHLKETEKEAGVASRSELDTGKHSTSSTAEDSSDSNEGSTEGSSSSSSSEGKAGEAIKTLLQEKITQKFKEAANEVKGVLVKQLGDSLKSAHDVFNPPKTIEAKKTASASSQKVQVGKAGAAAVHQNKGPRHRKNSGPQGTPGKTHHASTHHNHAPSVVSHGLPVVQSVPPPLILTTRSSAVNQALADRAAAMQEKPVGSSPLQLQHKQPAVPLLPPMSLAAAAVPQQRPAILPSQLTQRMVPNYNPLQAIPPRPLPNYMQRLAPVALLPATTNTLTSAQKTDTPAAPAAAPAAPLGPNSPGVQHVYLPMEEVQAPPGWPPQSIVPNTASSSPVATRTTDAPVSNQPNGNGRVGGEAPAAASASNKVESPQTSSTLPAISSISVPSD